jgi:hypothetical protein
MKMRDVVDDDDEAVAVQTALAWNEASGGFR